MRPLLHTIESAKLATGLGHTKIYELMSAGVLDARKAGSRTLITDASISAYVAGLPKADIRMTSRMVTKAA